MATIQNQQDEFLHDEIWILTFAGGFQRANVYADGISEKTRRNFRADIREKVSNLVSLHYADSTVGTEAHMDHLVHLKNWIDSSYPALLRAGEIKLGVVQKIFNLYLKYQWCRGEIKMPPHCPFDRIVIQQLDLNRDVAWTRMNSVDEYRFLVGEAQRKAGKKSIAEWELECFSPR